MPKTSEMLVWLYQSAKAVQRGEITPEQHVEGLCYHFMGFRPRIPKPKSRLTGGCFLLSNEDILSQIRYLVEDIE